LAGLGAVPVLGADGALRTSFGSSGLVTWSNHATVAFVDAAGTEDLVIGVGEWEPIGGPPRHLHWQAFTADGTLDTDHRCIGTTNDTLPFAFADASRATASIVDGSGRLVVVGALNLAGDDQDHGIVARFLLDQDGCVPDDAFHSYGWEMLDAVGGCASNDCVVEDVLEVRPATGAVTSPKLLLLLRRPVNLLVARFFLVRLNGSGSLDTSFGDGGSLEIADDALGSLGRAALAVDGQGRPYVAVSNYDPDQGLDVDVWALRYQADGSGLDPSFGTGGMLRVAASQGFDNSDDLVRAVAVTDDNSLIVSYWGSAMQYAAAYTKTTSGPTLIFVDSGTTAAPALVTQGNRRFIAVRETAVDGFRVYRTQLGPDLWGGDPSFNGSGHIDFDVDLGGSGSETVEHVRLWHGRPVYAGKAAKDGGTTGFLLLSESSYVFADGFEGGTTAYWPAAGSLAR